MNFLWDLVDEAVDFVIEKVREKSRADPHGLRHWYPRTWKKLGLGTSSTCYYCLRELPGRPPYSCKGARS